MTGVIEAAALAEVSPLKKLFGIVQPYLLAASLVGNVTLGLVARHYVHSAASCNAAVTATATAAKRTQVIVQTREVKNAKETDVVVRNRVGDALQRLHNNQGRVRAVPELSGPSGGAQPEGGTSVVLPVRELTETEKRDQEICVVNTILAEEWPKFYRRQMDIFSEELPPEGTIKTPPGEGGVN